MKEHIYLDHAATTPLDKSVLNKMMPYFTEVFGNANSQHYFGRQAAIAVDEARDYIAKQIGAKPSEIYFTSGGTEADNWALKGTAKQYQKKGKHIIITKIEHAAMIASAKELEKDGFEISYLSVDEFGKVDLEQLKSLIRPDTIFIGIMMANNEIGTIQPIEEASKIAKEHKIIFFTDAVQAAGSLKIDVSNGNIDLLSFSGHKFNGPKGIGVLYIKTGVLIGKLISGGHQERTRRGGTTNVPAIVGIAEAFKIATENMDEKNAYVKNLRDTFIERVIKEIPSVKLNGHRYNRLPNNANFSFEFVEGESILFSLDLKGIAVSSGSACSSGSLEASHVLLATGMSEGLSHGSIRFTFGKDNTMEEVNYTVDTLKEIIVKLRKMSPLFKLEKGEIKNV